MRFAKLKTLLVAVVLSAGVLAAVFGVPVVQRRLEAAEYPPPPFAAFPSDWPALLHEREWPRASEKLALEQYREERKKAAAFYRENGAQARFTSAEREAFEAYSNDKHIAAWEKAVAILKEDPNSICGLFCLAAAEFEGERNFPRALHVTRQARRLCEERGRVNPDDADAREMYIRIADLEDDILQALERFDEALLVIGNLERAYRPMPHMKVWPLVKLRRLDEAEANTAALETAGTWKSRCMNHRVILATLRRERAAAYRLGVEVSRQIDDSPVLWSNLGEAAMEDLRRAEAEAHYLKAAKMTRMNFDGSPWMALGNLYVDAGRFDEALAARIKAIAQRGQRSPHRLAFDQGRFDASLAELLLATGHVADGERLARRSLDRPDRLASNTLEPEARRLREKLLMAVALRARREEMREAGDASPWAAAAQDAECWAALRRLMTDIELPGRPNDLRPCVPDGAALTTWLSPTLLHALPPAAALQLVRQARADEIADASRLGEEETYAKAEPYFDALEAEAQFLLGRDAEALDFAQRALAKLPNPAERLLRGRTAAIAGEAARRLSRADESRELALRAWADFPVAFRLLSLAIPVNLTDDGTPEARNLVEQLARSPRVRLDANGVRLRVSRANGELHLIVNRNAKEDVETAPLDDPREALAAAHHLLLSPCRLDAVAINALDASGSAMKSREAIDKLFEPVRKKK